MTRTHTIVLSLLFAIATFGGTASAQPFCPGVTPWVFDDVQASDPFCGAITWMATSNITLGCSVIDADHRLYCPDTFVTRKAMAAFMKRQSEAMLPLTCATGQVMKWNGTSWACADDATAGGGAANAFVQGGNAFGAAAVLGTTDANALDIRVNGARVMRYEPNPISPNVIGGSPANFVTLGVRGATIAGGGVPLGNTDPNFGIEEPNRVTDAYGTVGGGYGNQAGDDAGSATDRGLATVGGGAVNRAVGGSSTIGGGEQNTASGWWSQVGGGQANTASDMYGTVGGGSNNTASGLSSTVSGGSGNTASAQYSTVAGGSANTASGGFSLAAGTRAQALADGVFALADSSNGFLIGNVANSLVVAFSGGIGLHTNKAKTLGCTISPAGDLACTGTIAGVGSGGDITGVAAGLGLTGGGTTGDVTIAADTTYLQRRVTGTCAAGSTISAIAADGSVTCQAGGGGGGGTNAFVNGGNNNFSQAVLGTLNNVALEFFVHGSQAMRIEPDAVSPRLVGGGSWNVATDAGGTVSGGGRAGNDCEDIATGNPPRICANQSIGPYATVAGGLANGAGISSTVSGGESNEATGVASTVAGGKRNVANGLQATVAGGLQNSAGEDFAVVAGGRENKAVFYAYVGGGNQNDASGPYSVIGGGSMNHTDAAGAFSTIAGGALNTASGLNASVGGGENNWADGDHATIPGGKLNSAAGDYSFASGFGANAVHAGSHVFADGQQGAGLVSTTAPNQFVVGAAGGIYLMNNRERTVGCSIVSGNLTCTGTIGAPSDRALKTGVAAVAPLDILDRVVALPIDSWEYRNAPGIRHVGPMAQDFRAAFGLGDDETRIAMVDANGVALAAIQGLNAKLEARVAEQAREIAALKVAVEVLLARTGSGKRVAEH